MFLLRQCLAQIFRNSRQAQNLGFVYILLFLLCPERGDWTGTYPLTLFDTCYAEPLIHRAYNTEIALQSFRPSGIFI
jgi:hypothetical protein